MKILDGNDFLMSNQEQLTATIGMFDGMHRGHITLINALKHEAMARHQRSAVITFRKHPQLVVNPGDSPRKSKPLLPLPPTTLYYSTSTRICRNFRPRISLNYYTTITTLRRLLWDITTASVTSAIPPLPTMWNKDGVPMSR